MKAKKGCLIAALTVLGILVVILVVMIAVFASIPRSSSSKASSVAPLTTKDIIATATDATPDQVTAIETILMECATVPLEIAHDDGLDHDGLIGYRITTTEVKNVILYLNQDNVVDKVKYADHVLHDGEEVLSPLSDYTITRKERDALQWQCMELVKGILKSPSSAKFPAITEWKMGKNEGTVTIQAYVDADNAFGANIRNDFQVILEGDTVTSFIVDGEELAG